MNSGLAFLQTQVGAAVVQHSAFVDALESHQNDASDHRYRELCSRFLSQEREHQRRLEALEQQLGSSAAAGGVAGTVRRLAETAVNVARDLADVAPVDDYTRLLADLSLCKACEQTLKVFRDAGRALGISALSDAGESAEREHDTFASEASRLLQQMFVEQARSAADVVRSTTTAGAHGASPHITP